MKLTGDIRPLSDEQGIQIDLSVYKEDELLLTEWKRWLEIFEITMINTKTKKPAISSHWKESDIQLFAEENFWFFSFDCSWSTGCRLVGLDLFVMLICKIGWAYKLISSLNTASNSIAVFGWNTINMMIILHIYYRKFAFSEIWQEYQHFYWTKPFFNSQEDRGCKFRCLGSRFPIMTILAIWYSRYQYPIERIPVFRRKDTSIRFVKYIVPISKEPSSDPDDTGIGFFLFS